MATVPSAFRSGLGQRVIRAENTPFQNRSASPDSFGAVQGRGLQQAGQGVAQIAMVSQEMKSDSDKIAATKALNQARRKTNELTLGGIYSKTSDEVFSSGRSPQQVFKDSGEFFEEGRSFGEELLESEAQRKLFNTMYQEYQVGEETRMGKHLANQFRGYKAQVSEEQKGHVQEELGGVAAEIEQDWTKAPELVQKGVDTVTRYFNQLGLSKKDAVEVLQEWPAYVSSSAIRGWFAQEPSSLEAAKQLASGKFELEEIQEYWNNLDPKQRKALSNDLIGRAQKVAQLENDQRETANEAVEAGVQKKVNDFFVNDKPEQKQLRQQIYDEVKNSPYVKDSVKEAMRENLYGGQQTQDNEEGLVQLELEIREGNIETFEDAQAFTYNGKRVATDKTMRTRIFPLIQSMQDKDFQDAYNAGLAYMGITDTISETNTVLRQRAATFKSRMLRWKNLEDKNNEDVWTASDRIAKEIRADIKVDPAVMSMLKRLKTSYDKQVSEGNPIAAEGTLTQMRGLMDLLGITMEDIK